jgi:hypothetical protein
MMPKSSATSFSSRLAVGSSSTSSRADVSSARAMATICCMATESEPSSASTSHSTSSRASAARARRRMARQLRKPSAPGWRPSVMFSATESEGIKVHLLVNRADPERARRPSARSGRMVWPARRDLAGIGRMHAGQHLDEGGLARAVLAEQRVDLAGADSEVHARQRHDSWKFLPDAAEFEEGRCIHATSSPQPTIRSAAKDSSRYTLAAVPVDSSLRSERQNKSILPRRQRGGRVGRVEQLVLVVGLARDLLAGEHLGHRVVNLGPEERVAFDGAVDLAGRRRPARPRARRRW